VTILLIAILLVMICVILLLLGLSNDAPAAPELSIETIPPLRLTASPDQLVEQRDVAPIWASVEGKEASDRHAQSILFFFIDALPSPALPFLQHAPLFYDGLIGGRTVQLFAWRCNPTSPALVFELKTPLTWAADTDLAIHMRPHPLDAQAIRSGLSDLDSALALHGTSHDLLHLLCLHDAQLTPGTSEALASLSLDQGQLTLRWIVGEPDEATKLARSIPSILSRWVELKQRLPSPKALLRSLLAEPEHPNPTLIAALAPDGAMHSYLGEILHNPALTAEQLRPLAWILASNFPKEAPDTLFTEPLIQYGLSLATDDAQRDAVLDRTSPLLSPEQWSTLLHTSLTSEDPSRRLWAAAHAILNPAHQQLYLEGITRLCALLAHPEHHARARALLAPRMLAQAHLYWAEPFTIFTTRLDKSKDPDGASKDWLTFMSDREHVQLALTAATTAAALRRDEVKGSLDHLFQHIDQIQDPTLHHSLFLHLWSITPEDHALALRIFHAATQRASIALEHLATQIAAAHPDDPDYIPGLEQLAANGRDETQRVRAIRALILRLPQDQRTIRLGALATQGIPSIRLAAISFMQGREALAAFADCLTQGVCPPQLIADSLEWFDDLLATEPDLWTLLLDAFGPIPRFERLLSITLLMERGADPPAWLINRLFDKEELRSVLARGEQVSIYNRTWGALSPWLIALPHSPDAEQLWRTALLPAPANTTLQLINLLGAHASGPAIGALAPLIDHPTFGPAARDATRAIEQRLGAHMAGSLEWVDHDDQRGQLSLSAPTKGQLSSVPEQLK
jgi:hypothetical protein